MAPQRAAAEDRAIMARAIALGMSRKGATTPNPAVGAVVVNGGVIVGEGFHEAAGRPHAEVIALRGAGEKARGGTLYVTLEPCVQTGRTPPCAPEVVAAGIKRVVVGTLDPNPANAGRGAAYLKEAGLQVTVGVRERECRLLIADFAKFITTGRPWVTAKFAASLDGKIATRTGESRWITGERARQYAHELRARHAAVVVGKGTVVADDPQLTVRARSVKEAPRLVRVVVATDADVPITARVFEGRKTFPAWVAYGEGAPPRNLKRLTARGVTLVPCRRKHGKVSLASLLDELGRRGINSILVEGGGELLGSFFDEGLVDAVAVFMAPTIIGGRGARTAVAGRGVEKLVEAAILKKVRRKVLGRDELIEGWIADINEYFKGVAGFTRALKRGGR